MPPPNFFEIHAALLVTGTKISVAGQFGMTEAGVDQVFASHTYNGKYLSLFEWQQLTAEQLVLEKDGKALLEKSSSVNLKHVSMKDIYPRIHDSPSFYNAAHRLGVSRRNLITFFAVYSPITLEMLNKCTSDELEKDYPCFTQQRLTRKRISSTRTLKEIYEMATTGNPPPSLYTLCVEKLGIASLKLTRILRKLDITYEALQQLSESQFRERFKGSVHLNFDGDKVTRSENTEEVTLENQEESPGQAALADVTPPPLMGIPTPSPLFPSGFPGFESLWGDFDGHSLGHNRASLEQWEAQLRNRTAELDKRETSLRVQTADLEKREARLAHKSAAFKKAAAILAEVGIDTDVLDKKGKGKRKNEGDKFSAYPIGGRARFYSPTPPPMDDSDEIDLSMVNIRPIN